MRVAQVAGSAPFLEAQKEEVDLQEVSTEDSVTLRKADDVEPLSSDAEAVDEGWHGSLKCLMLLLNLAGALEGADIALFPCVLLPLEHDLGFKLHHLAIMATAQALAGQLAAPLWAVVADRGVMQRKSLIALGCIGQGCITAALAGINSFAAMLVLRGINGACLAALAPIANGIIADIASEENRGKMFSTMGIALHIGMMFGAFIATNLGRKMVLGFQGWRVTFALVGLLCTLVGLLIYALMREPPKSRGTSSDARGFAAVRAEAKELGKYFRIPSFCVLVAQGLFGTMPWVALSYKTLFFQLAGVSDFQISLIETGAQVAGSFGMILGGCVSDLLSRWSRHHGRPIAAQITVFSGIPVVWCLFKVTPPGQWAFAYYFALIVTLFLFATWCGVAVNLPILSELVKEDRRATIIAWQSTMQSTISSVCAHNMVGLLAEHVFGYNLKNISSVDAKDPQKMHALGSTLFLVSFIPWMICLSIWSLLHCTYARDLKNVRSRVNSSDAPLLSLESEDEEDAWPVRIEQHSA